MDNRTTATLVDLETRATADLLELVERRTSVPQNSDTVTTVFSRYKKTLTCMGSAFGAVDVSYTAFWHFPNYKNPQIKEI